ncbi:MAG: hypothetical protein ABIG32_02540 [Candidatus Uhrbacteria bacterium]|nr:hypothetical protein [Patescibacteria group bacterium]MBU1907073.1 hypothetical protein [Patescibacteria group bacterium]
MPRKTTKSRLATRRDPATSKLAGKKTAKKETPKASPQVVPSLKLYRRLAVGFILVTLVLLAIIIIVSTIRATIKIFPNADIVQTSFITDILEEPGVHGEIPGQILSVTLEEAREFTASGEGATEVPGKAGGMVTLYNTSNSPQPLVATTRLLSPEGVLYRIDEAVTVPAQGTVEVMAHADLEGKSYELGPTKFTIPGLAASRQTEVYAENSEAMTGGIQYLKTLSQTDIDAAGDELQASLLAAAQEELRTQLTGKYTGESFFTEVLEQVSDTEPGTEADSFTISMKVEVVGVFFDQETLLNIAEAKLYESLPRGYELVSIDRENMEVTVERYDVEEAVANVRVSLQGAMIVSPNNKILDKDDLTGLSPQEVAKRFIDAGIAVDVEVNFSPFWIKKVPRLKDRIDIQIEPIE